MHMLADNRMRVAARGILRNGLKKNKNKNKKKNKKKKMKIPCITRSCMPSGSKAKRKGYVKNGC